MKRRAWIAAGVMLAGAGTAVCAREGRAQPASGAQESATPNSTGGGLDERGRNQAALRALLDEFYERELREEPVSASIRGDDRFADRLRDESPEAFERRTREDAAFLARVRGLARAGLSETELLDADLLEYELRERVTLATLHLEQMPLDSLGGPHVWLPQMADRTPLRTPAQRAGYVVRLEAIPETLKQLERRMRMGMEAGRVPPRVILARTVGRIRAQAEARFATSPEESPFFRPFVGATAEEAELASRARRAIGDGIVPAFARFADFVEKEYVPACRETIGTAQGVDGERAYDLLLASHTTTEMTAREVHALGLREVAALRAEMLGVVREVGFSADGAGASGGRSEEDALLRAFLEHLRNEPRFRWESGEAMLRDYRELCKRIDPELPRLFRTLPRNPYGVREIPRFAAPVSPVAYYYPGSVRSGVPGWFMVNTGSLDKRHRFAMVSLTIHEAVPGHHLQVALADELSESGGLHPFRTLLGYTAFVEGWALYSERLGLEMAGGRLGAALNPAGLAPHERGLYADPYDNFGRLSDEMWRACRLVVDTGIHALGWSRQEAIDYLLANTAISEVDAVSEVDRYIGWPGQACAYKIGQLRILELRERAQREMGERFDIRGFHDAVLLAGSVPLPVLEKRVERWIRGG